MTIDHDTQEAQERLRDRRRQYDLPDPSERPQEASSPRLLASVLPLRPVDPAARLVAGAHVVVIGRGVTVGRPLGLLLTRRSENATVTLCHTGTRDLPSLTRQADIIVAAVGVPHMLTADMVRPGAAVVDVGVSRVDGKLTGDVHPDVWGAAGHVSPNPGGVGPLTRAFLLTNVVELADAHSVRAEALAVLGRRDEAIAAAREAIAAGPHFDQPVPLRRQGPAADRRGRQQQRGAPGQREECVG